MFPGTSGKCRLVVVDSSDGQVDDEVRVNTPSGVREWYINHIRYSPFED
jgi:hypothetical protein